MHRHEDLKLMRKLVKRVCLLYRSSFVNQISPELKYSVLLGIEFHMELTM